MIDCKKSEIRYSKKGSYCMNVCRRSNNYRTCSRGTRRNSNASRLRLKQMVFMTRFRRKRRGKKRRMTCLSTTLLIKMERSLRRDKLFIMLSRRRRSRRENRNNSRKRKRNSSKR